MEQDIGWPVCGLIGATVRVMVNVIFVVPVLVNVNAGFCAVVLLIVELPVPPEGGETDHVHCNCKGVPLHEGDCDVLLDVTFSTEQPDGGVNVNAQVVGGITQTVSVLVSSPQPLAICCVIEYSPGCENVRGSVFEPGVHAV